jgi:hypothetical protein
MAQSQNEETKKPEDDPPVFRVSGRRKTQHHVFNQKQTAFFSLFLRQLEVVPKRKLCYNDRN